MIPEQIMPINERYPMAELLGGPQKFTEQRKDDHARIHFNQRY